MALDFSRREIEREIDNTQAEIMLALWQMPADIKRAKTLISKRMGLRVCGGERRLPEVLQVGFRGEADMNGQPQTAESVANDMGSPMSQKARATRRLPERLSLVTIVLVACGEQGVHAHTGHAISL
jgi:hypothetical protein